MHRMSRLGPGAAALLLLALTACGGGEQTTTETDTISAAVPVVTTYRVRGRIVSLPTSPGGDIQIAHEAIPDLVDAEGNVLGMDAMTMFFGLDEAIQRDAFQIGDVIEFDLAVDWQGDPPAAVTWMSKLPEDTELVFSKAESNR